MRYTIVELGFFISYGKMFFFDKAYVEMVNGIGEEILKL